MDQVAEIQATVNELEYNGNLIVEVKYSDSSGVLQDVEMNMGDTEVWRV